MNRWPVRVWIGAGLVVLGALMLLERFGVMQGLANLFWGLIFAAGGAWFLYRFTLRTRSEWWAAIPGFTLLGLGAETVLPSALSNWSGFLFLGAIGLGFLAVYFSGRERWWALIPGGVLVTLGLISVVGEFFGGRETGGLLMLGFGITFLLVAILASQQWAWIPGIVLLVIGAFIGTPFAGAINYAWPIALIAGGLLLIVQFMRRSR
jgi:hypothetical protein